MTTVDVAYEVRAIEPEALRQLWERDDAGNPPRLLVHEDGGSPLRCCLRPVRPGERVALVSYAPLRRWAERTGADPGPYNEVGPVFIHPQPCDGPRGSGYPYELRSSHRVFRAYSRDGRILGGRLVPDDDAVESVLADLFADPEVAMVHVRAVEFGCFFFAVHRR
ncbi:DUF1203 domain-containing protein [Gandjariella thermophila]|uniref:DUF1203 domain-containing protein n=1 Tax=Gandjariella thermophila TaxID=1931992 RepID=A0A4D4J8K1_9PSEU|nr:DUF1203 domain-containing protein [Gandjariella thermophila]GDY30826.1 hypothetical protein GTS_24590 [Gandjariella thermophila]